MLPHIFQVFMIPIKLKQIIFKFIYDQRSVSNCFNISVRYPLIKMFFKHIQRPHKNNIRYIGKG